MLPPHRQDISNRNPLAPSHGEEGLLTRLAAIVGGIGLVAAAVLVLAFFLGVVFLISAVIALTIIGAVLSYRARKYRSRGGPRPPGGEGGRQGEVLEGEWREVRPSERRGPDGP